MASLVTYGTVTKWGVEESCQDSNILADSFSFDLSTKNHVVTDKQGKNVGWIGYDQSASFSLSGRVLSLENSPPAMVMGKLALSSMSVANNYFSGAITPDANSYTVVTEGVSYSTSAESPVSLTYSGTIYNFASGT